MVAKIDHIGILVADIEANVSLFDLLDLEIGSIERVPGFGVTIAFIRVGETLVELIEPVDEHSQLAGDLEKAANPAMLHHIAFRVDDLAAKLESLASAGVPLADETPRQGAGDSKVAFLDDRAANGVSVELVEREAAVTFD